MYSRKDTNLVFTRFISHGEVLCYNRAKINSFILKCLEKFRRKINQLHQSLCYTSSIYYTTQNNPWICRYRFNGKINWFFSVSPLTHVKLQKSIVEFHTSKNILKMIKQRNQSHQVLFYISNTHFYTLVCWFHVNKEVYWFLNRPPPFLPRTLPFWQMMVNNP